jgi:hypothetical protein
LAQVEVEVVDAETKTGFHRPADRSIHAKRQDGRFARHLSEQYLTSAQSRSHFFRQENALPQVAHVFSGKLAFLIIFAM